MPIIRANTGIVTQINVFTVPDGGQQALIEALADSAEIARGVPGWISASLHRSRDGTRVVNYAQSDGPASARLIVERLREAGCLERHAELGTAHPGLYDVVVTLER